MLGFWFLTFLKLTSRSKVLWLWSRHTRRLRRTSRSVGAQRQCDTNGLNKKKKHWCYKNWRFVQMERFCLIFEKRNHQRTDWSGCSSGRCNYCVHCVNWPISARMEWRSSLLRACWNKQKEKHHQLDSFSTGHSDNVNPDNAQSIKLTVVMLQTKQPSQLQSINMAITAVADSIDPWISSSDCPILFF